MLDGSLRPAAGCRPRGLAGAEGSGPARIKKNPFWHAARRPRSACTGPTPPFKLPRVLLTGAERKQAWLVIARPEETRSYGYWAYNNSTSDEPLRRVNSMATDSALDGDGSPVETKTTNDHAGALCAAPLMLSTFANCAWRV